MVLTLKKIKTLLIVGGHPIHHFHICGLEIEDILIKDGRFEVEKVEDDLSIFESSRLKSYDVIVLYWTGGEISDFQLNGLSNFINIGGGLVGIHSATDAFHNNPCYEAMIGGRLFMHKDFRKYHVSVTNSQHPITKDLDEFWVEDEQYIMDYDHRVNVLCSALWKGQTMPVAWTKKWGKGRIYYLALGHRSDAWHESDGCKQEIFKVLLTRGISWVSKNNKNTEDD